jgi:Tfp pilus assembly PilM family ATPase
MSDWEHSPYAYDVKEVLNRMYIDQFINQRKIQEVYLTGLRAGVEGLHKVLEGHLKTDISLADVWVNCFDSQYYVPNIDVQRALKYDVAIGVALK